MSSAVLDPPAARRDEHDLQERVDRARRAREQAEKLIRERHDKPNPKKEWVTERGWAPPA